MPKNAAAENLAETLIDAYKEGKKEAEVFDNLITKLERRARQLRMEQDKKNVLLASQVESMAETAKKLRDHCIEASEKKAKKAAEQKRARKDANLSAGYYLASLRMFQTLALEDPENRIFKNQAKGAFSGEFNNLFDAYLTEWKKLTVERYKAFGKSIGIDVKDETVKTDVGEFEVFEHTEKPEEKPTETPLEEVFVPVPKDELDDEKEPEEEEDEEYDEEFRENAKKHIPGMGFGGGIGF